MTGAEHARTAVAEYLREMFPVKLAALETRGVPTPAPRLIAATAVPRVSGSDMPAVVVTRARRQATREVETNPDSVRYLCDYGLQIFIWARGRDTDDTARNVDRLELAVMELLLDRPTVGAATAATFFVAPESYVASYSDVGPLDGQGGDEDLRHFAGCRADITVVVEETLDVATFPWTDTTVTMLPTHPALA